MNTLDEFYLKMNEVFYNEKIEKLSTITIKNLLLAYNGCDWQTYCSFSRKSYTRVHLFQNHYFEARLLCWEIGQDSLPHNHPKQGCIMKVLQGELSEQYYSLDAKKFLGSAFLKKDSISYIDDSQGLHAIKNINNGPSVSLHIYSPPGYIPKFYLNRQEANV